MLLHNNVVCLGTYVKKMCSVLLANCDEGTLAYASHCMIDTSSNNRPVAGYINICPLVSGLCMRHLYSVIHLLICAYCMPLTHCTILCV